MSVYKDEKTGKWYALAWYHDWKGEGHQKCKRGFETKKEAQDWERSYVQQNAAGIDMTFEAFCGLYEKDRRPRLKESTWLTKENIIKNKLIISQYDNGCGYLQVVIRNDNGEAKSMRVHRLVYMAHKGEIPKGLEINHKDECKTNNCIDNLELVTRAENNNYGTHNQRISKSMKRYRAKQRAMAAC